MPQKFVWIKIKNRINLDVCWVKRLGLVSSAWPCWSFLCPAFSAVNWSAWVWFEWDFTFLTAFRASCLMHFFFGHYFQLLLYVYGAKNRFLHDAFMQFKGAYKIVVKWEKCRRLLKRLYPKTSLNNSLEALHWN